MSPRARSANGHGFIKVPLHADGVGVEIEDDSRTEMSIADSDVEENWNMDLRDF